MNINKPGDPKKTGPKKAKKLVPKPSNFGTKHEAIHSAGMLDEVEVVFNKKKGTVTKKIPKFAPSKTLRPLKPSHDGPDNKQAVEKLAKVAQNLGKMGTVYKPAQKAGEKVSQAVKGKQTRAKAVLKSWNMFGDDTQEVKNDSIFVTKLNKNMPFDSSGVQMMKDPKGKSFVEASERLTYKDGKIQKQ